MASFLGSIGLRISSGGEALLFWKIESHRSTSPWQGCDPHRRNIRHRGAGRPRTRQSRRAARATDTNSFERSIFVRIYRGPTNDIEQPARLLRASRSFKPTQHTKVCNKMD